MIAVFVLMRKERCWGVGSLRKGKSLVYVEQNNVVMARKGGQEEGENKSKLRLGIGDGDGDFAASLFVKVKRAAASQSPSAQGSCDGDGACHLQPQRQTEKKTTEEGAASVIGAP
jgi:hypothetical protein